jgi:hypothetical protein
MASASSSYSLSSASNSSADFNCRKAFIPRACSWIVELP